MDSITIMMTGLLLLTPDHPSGRGPTHVLMPEPRGGHVPPHVALVVFVGTYGEHCLNEDPEKDRFCVVDMDGWLMELDSTSRGSSGPDSLPRSLANLTLASGKPLGPHFVGTRPGRRVRSRISFHSGRVTRTCDRAVWRYRPEGAAKEDTLPLANVVEWKIPQDSLVLERSRLDPILGDTAERLGVVRADSGDLHLVIVYMPIGAAANLLAPAPTRLFRPATRSRVQVAKDRPGRPNMEEPDTTTEATHFQAYYNLLGATQGKRPIPVLVDKLNDADEDLCPPELRAMFEQFLAGELSCMVASARTAP